MGMPRTCWRAALALSLLAVPVLFSLGAGAGEAGAAKAVREATDATGVQKLTKEQIAFVETLFEASEMEVLEDGTVHLVYDFESMNESLVSDWGPALDRLKGRVRWSRGSEGTPTSVEHGIMIADSGTWTHMALWKNLEMQVEYMSTSGMRKGDLLAASFTDQKGKRALGSNLGEQCVRLRGKRLAGKPIGEFPTLSSETRHRFGYRLENGKFSAQKNRRTQVDTAQHPKFVKGLSSGRAGLSWRGTVQGFVFMISLKGTLDPDWVNKHMELAPEQAR